MVVADGKNEWASKFMEWGEDLYDNGDCDHLCRASIYPTKDNQCTDKDESLYLVDSHSDHTSIASNDSTNDSVLLMSLSEVADLGLIVMDPN
jgi:hypothetical protein